MSSSAKSTAEKNASGKTGSTKTGSGQITSAKMTASQKPSGPKLQLDSEVARCIRQHARSHMKTEVCGVLIGEMNDGIVEVQASIEALNASQAGTHVTFTQDAWESIYKIKDESYPDERIVGWYHSHPGFGVFLSEHDTFIHRNFFSSPDQVAWVYDPHTDEEGCFGWIDGDIHRVPLFSIIDNSGDGIERTPKSTDSSQYDEEEDDLPRTLKAERREGPPAWLRWTVTVLSYICALAVGFLISWILFPRVIAIPVNPFTGDPLELPERSLPERPRQSVTPPAPGSGPGDTISPGNTSQPAQTPSAKPSPPQPSAKPAPVPNPGGNK